MTINHLIKQLKDIGKNVTPSRYFRITSKERLLYVIQESSSSHNNRYTYLWKKWISASIITALLFLSCIPFIPFSSQTALAYVGEATVSGGHMRILNVYNEEKTISSSTRLQIGDTIETLNSNVEINFIDESQSFLSKEAVLKIENFLANPDDLKNSIVFLSLQKGEMRNIVNKQGGEIGDIAQMKIETPSSLIEATKSDFAVQVSSTGETVVKAMQDSVEVKAISSGKILAQAQAMKGYSIKIGSTKNKKQAMNTPLEIISLTDANTNKNTSRPNEATSLSASPLPVIDESLQNSLLSNLDIAEVKLYQGMKFLEEKNSEEALTAFQSYREKISHALHLLSAQYTIHTYKNASLSNIFGDRLLGDFKQQVSSITDETFKAKVFKQLATFSTLEESLIDTMIFSSITIFETQNDNSNTANENISPAVNMNSSKENEPKFKLDGKVIFAIENAKSLLQLQEKTTSEEKKTEIEELIAGSVNSIAQYINEIADWKEQKMATTAILNLFPSSIDYEKMLRKLQLQSSDRVSFLFFNKLNRLQ